jgi:Domain of unknown function (DUF305)
MRWRRFVSGVSGRFELEGGVLDVELPGQAVLDLIEHLGRVLHSWLTSWHQPTSSPTSYAGRVDAAHFRAMSAMHGNAFDGDWLEHMAGNYTAAIAACQQELDHGTNPQAGQLAATRLAAMRTELGQIRLWHSDWEHDSRLGSATPGDPATSRPHDTPHPGYSSDPGHMSSAPPLQQQPPARLLRTHEHRTTPQRQPAPGRVPG